MPTSLQYLTASSAIFRKWVSNLLTTSTETWCKITWDVGNPEGQIRYFDRSIWKKKPSLKGVDRWFGSYGFDPATVEHVEGNVSMIGFENFYNAFSLEERAQEQSFVMNMRAPCIAAANSPLCEAKTNCTSNRYHAMRLLVDSMDKARKQNYRFLVITMSKGGQGEPLCFGLCN